MCTLLQLCPLSDWQEAQAANRFGPGRRGLVLLTIDRRRVRPKVRFEPAGGSFFPHFYGPLNLEAVTELREFEPGKDGTFSV